ncbi:MAG: cupin domain-containing protein [Cyanobium sp.]
MTVEHLIRRYGLEPHPEGGWYREVHRSARSIRRDDGERRAALTTILFLLQAGEFSRWHRVSGADETWHHAGGAPLELFSLPPAGGDLRRQRLATIGFERPDGHAQHESRHAEVSAVLAAGPHPGLENSEPLAVVPAGWWQAARSLGAWSLVSCCVGPGFEFADFSLLRELPIGDRPVEALPDFL